MDRQEKLFRKQQNIYRVHEFVDSVVLGVQKGSQFSFTEDLIKRMHSIAMQVLLERPGEYRNCPVTISNSPHVCPNWIDVPVHMKMICEYVSQNWETRDLIHLGAFVMWRLNWTHAFQNGNGRTARAAAYLVMGARHGQLLPPKNTIIEQIQANKQPYYDFLRQADDIYKNTQDIDQALAPLENYLSHLLKEQIKANL